VEVQSHFTNLPPEPILCESFSSSEWLGQLAEEAHYDALIEWARACHTAKTLMPHPEALSKFRFTRYIQECIR